MIRRIAASVLLAAFAAFLGIPDLGGAKIGFAPTSPIAAVPEPETDAMLLAGLCLITPAARRRTQCIGTIRGRPARPDSEG